MSEFEFLDKAFHRLREARGLRYHDEQRIAANHTGKKPAPCSAFETAELMIRGTIEDYLKLRRSDAK